ncbi:MAG: MarR family winged helix-turn-helix transcriptional regulator [Anaerocolumna sp.]
MKEQKENLNKFLIHVFHDILRLEETALTKGDYKNLSINEMHVIEAVHNGNMEGLHTMTEIAAKLMVTASTLTTSVKTLERKGYLIRSKLKEDKRRVNVELTSLGIKAYDKHKEFHAKLVDDIANNLETKELTALENALSILHDFFNTIN